jgi:hypothetical protein
MKLNRGNKTKGPTFDEIDPFSTVITNFGRGGIRTLGLYSAIVALSQLSYAPFGLVVIVADGTPFVKT